MMPFPATYVALVTILTSTSVNAAKCSECDAFIAKYVQWQISTMNSRPKDTRECKPFKDKPVAFHARLDRAPVVDLPGESALKFDEVVTNEGSGYDNTTGIFTAPTEGFYSFSWTYRTKPGTAAQTVFVLDGKVVAYTSNSPANQWDSTSQSAVLKLNKGNKVWLKPFHNAGKYFGVMFSSFSGFKI